MAKKRMTQQDVAKGIAILVVLMTHTVSFPSVFYKYFMACIGYVMPFFFFMSGYNYRPHRAGYGANIKKRASQLLVPMLVYSVGMYVVVGLYMFFAGKCTLGEIPVHFLDALLPKELFNILPFTATNRYLSVMRPVWFIKYMFMGYLIFYAVADYSLESSKRFISVNVLLLSVTMILKALNVGISWGIPEAPAVASIMLFGALFGKYRVMDDDGDVRWTVVNCAAAFAIYFTFAMLFPNAGTMAGGSIVRVINPWEVLLTLMAAVVGSYILVNVCRLIDKIPVINQFLRWVGRNTMPILLVHIGASKIISDITGFTSSFGGPKEYVANFDMGSIAVFLLTVASVCVYIFIWTKIKDWFAAKKQADQKAG